MLAVSSRAVVTQYFGVCSALARTLRHIIGRHRNTRAVPEQLQLASQLPPLHCITCTSLRDYRPARPRGTCSSLPSHRRAGAASGEGEASALTPHLHIVMGHCAGMAQVSAHQLSLAEAEMETHEASTFGVAGFGVAG